MAPPVPRAPGAPGAPVRRPRRGELHDYYFAYVDLVSGDDVLLELERGIGATLAVVAELGEARAEHRYAPGKWSVKELLGHVVDGERVFAYRAMHMARGAATPLPDFDQDEFVAAAASDRRTLADLGAELAELRAANLRFFSGLAPEAWERRGTAAGRPFVVCAFPWILCGHETHHRRVLAERYGASGRA